MHLLVKLWVMLMSAEIDKAENEADKFASMVLHYSHNAEHYIQTKELQKASEMIWGALSCTLKTVAAKHDKEIKSHKQLGEFARELAKNENNKDILNAYSHASTLHQNFYESNLDEKTIRIFIDDIRKIIGKLMISMGYRAP